MQQLLFGIFAHPDDEAFGPGVFLHDQAAKGTDVHLVLATDGESGPNDGYDDLRAVRLAEWEESTKRIGATSRLALHYPDGGLCNSLYLEIAHKVLDHVRHTSQNYGHPVQINLLTFEERGISGHLDHIAMSFIATYVFEKLKESPPHQATIGTLRYYCLSQTLADHCNCNWLYMAAGRSKDEIDEWHSYADRIELKRHLMSAHHSQKNDCESILAGIEGDHGEQTKDRACDHFIVRH